MNIAVRIHERRLIGRQIVTSERKDLHFVVHKATSLSKAKSRARAEFEERNPTMVWMGASFVSQQELKATVAAKPPPVKRSDPVFIPGTGGQYTTTGRRRR